MVNTPFRRPSAVRSVETQWRPFATHTGSDCHHPTVYRISSNRRVVVWRCAACQKFIEVPRHG